MSAVEQPSQDPSLEAQPVAASPEYIETIVRREEIKTTFTYTSPESLLVKKAQNLLVIPRSPYDSTANTPPTFTFLEEANSNRRDPQVGIQNIPDQSNVPLILSQQTQLSKGQLVAIPLPKDTEAISLQLSQNSKGEPGPTVHIKQQRNRYIITSVAGDERALSVNVPTVVGFSEHIAMETVRAYPKTKNTETVDTKTLLDQQQNILCLTIVTVEGEHYLLCEGLDKTVITLPETLTTRALKEQKEMVNYQEDFGNAALMTVANHPKHLERNDDAASFNPQTLTAIINDGMGGYADGYFVSRLARNLLARATEQLPTVGNPEKITKQLEQTLQHVHRQLKNIPTDGDTTALVAKVVKEKNKQYLVWAGVGDGRLYRFRQDKSGGTLTQISVDDSVIRRWQRRALKNNGMLDLSADASKDYLLPAFEQAGFEMKGELVRLDEQLLQMYTNMLDRTTDVSIFESHPLLSFLRDNRNITDGLRNGPSTGELEEIHSGYIPAEKGDAFLLVSDAVPDDLLPWQIVEMMKKGKKPIEQASAIVQQVLAFQKEVPWSQEKRIKDDDVTALVIHI